MKSVGISEIIEDMAGHFGLKLVKGTEGMTFSRVVETEAYYLDRKGKVTDRQLAPIRDSKANDFALGLMGSFVSALGFNLDEIIGGAEGEVKGHTLQLCSISEGGEGNKVTKLLIVLRFPRSLDYVLNIYPEHSLHRIGKFLFRLQDIQMGHPELDKKVMVKAKRVSSAKNLLSYDRAHQALLDLYDGSFEYAVVNDASARVIINRRVNPSEYDTILEKLLNVSKALGLCQ